MKIHKLFILFILVGSWSLSAESYVLGGDGYSYSNGASDFLLYKVNAAGSELWRKNYGGLGDEVESSLRVTADGGFLLAGLTDSYTNGSSDLLIYKLYADGAKQWRRNYGGLYDEYLSAAIQTADGGYLLFGHSYSYSSDPSSDADFLLYKIDATGAKRWRRSYGGTGLEHVAADGWPVGEGAIQTVDGGYAFIGSTSSYVHGGSDWDVLIYKVNAQGEKQWRRNLGGVGWDYGYAIEQTDDGGYIVAGHTESYGNGEEDFLVYKLNAAGLKQWRRTYGGDQSDEAFVIREIPGGYVVAGRTYSYSVGGSATDDRNFLLYKLDTAGNEMWRKSYGGSGYDRAGGIRQTADGGYIFPGYTETYVHGDPGDNDFLVYKLTASGAKQWRKNYGGVSSDYCLTVQVVDD